ncbi:hypothetical protein MNBD_GAMMA07-2423 [hydrothermal vent metagenome]|uniref:DUF2931 family protein n=1 Tax=hydrothermal vent metagenome TaxID=652676 RepID=A0A3B0WX76_9ZZZZ
MKKFDWEASECGPKGYPVRVVSGAFIFPDGGSLYVPTRNTLNGPWGTGVSHHAVGADLKSLPNKLDITFISLTENQFYHGEFDLPYDTILKLFQEKYYAIVDGRQERYTQITVGMLPGGGVAVWVSGIGSTKKADIDWARLTDSDMPREEYVMLSVKERLPPEAINTIKTYGIPTDKWVNYRTRYHWKPLFTGMKIEDNLITQVKYYNGENGSLYSPENDKIKTDTLAVPKFMSFTWLRGKPGAGHDLMLEIYFDETETLAAFKQLGAYNAELQLEMRMSKDENGREGMNIWLLNNKDSLRLKKVKVESYGVPVKK